MNEQQKRLEALADRLGDGWCIGNLEADRWSGFRLDFSWDGPPLTDSDVQPAGASLPQADPTSEYLHRNYSCLMDSVPGLLKFRDLEAVDQFLTVLEANGSVFPNGGAIATAYGSVHYNGWRDAIYNYVEDCGPEELPATGDGPPYWRDDLKWLADLYPDVDCYTTVGEANAYGHYASIPAPTNDNGESIAGAVLVAVLAEPGAEAEVELSYYNESLTDLEAILLANLLVTSSDDQYAYVHYDLMGGVWAVPTEDCEDREAMLATIVESAPDGMDRYYSWLADYPQTAEERIKVDWSR